MDDPRADLINRALDLPDGEIVHRIRTGDAALFGRLFDAYWALLCQVAMFSLHDPDDAREAVADVFAAIWERRESLVVHTTIEAYLFGAVRRRARRAYRDDTHREALLAAQDPEVWDIVSAYGQQAAHGDRMADASASRLTVEQLLRTLPPRYQMAVYLRWQRDLEYDEIADVLEISREAAKKLVLRAVAMLRERA